jgi:hypothetical protein
MNPSKRAKRYACVAMGAVSPVRDHSMVAYLTGYRSRNREVRRLKLDAAHWENLARKAWAKQAETDKAMELLKRRVNSAYPES